MDKSKPKLNPKNKDSGKVRKVSLPSTKAQSRIPINELRDNFRRQISLPKEKDIIPIFDPMAKAQDSICSARQKTGIIFDEAMNEHYCLWDKNFPEKPERLSCILERCKELNLFSECEVISPVSATKEDIMTVHAEPLYETLKKVETASIEDLKTLSIKYQDMYMNQKTFDAATLSAGCCLELTKNVLEGKIQNGMALVRPPGHHAMLNEYNGYCFFNNIAIAARYALKKVNRVLIVDWDIHHGQGTQRLFYDDQRVLFFSTHRYENGKSWPHLRDGNYDSIGAAGGEGFSFNIPLNQTGMGNAEFLAYFHQVLLPVAYEYSPELVLISGGFDSALGDPKGMMKTTPAMYAHLTSMLMSLAGGKVVVLLEGGYCLESLSEGAMHTLRTLMGNPCPRLIDPIGPPCQSMSETILNVIYAHEPYWKCLAYQPKFDENSEDLLTIDPLDFKLEKLPKHFPKVVFEGPEPDLPGTIYPLVDYVCEYTPEENEENHKELLRLKEGTSLTVSSKRTCLVYDADMEKHCNVVDKSFPERPARTIEIMKKLKDFGIVKRSTNLKSRRAEKWELELFHEKKFVDFMCNLANMSPRERVQLEDNYYSIYFHESTWDCALLATGSLLQVVDEVCSGLHQNGLAVIRPPGHHAEVDVPCGFCFFNNVCIAAKYAQQKYPMKRILIVDWDVHHGNGTQHCFETDPSVMYVSIHVYKDGNFFPFSKEGDAIYVGEGPGRGYNINIPWSKAGMGDGDYISAFTQVILPIAYQFNPDLVLVSAGFDAAVNDPLGGCCVTPECYGHLTHMLMSLANGKVILALEGGYNLASISHAMTMCAKALLGDPIPRLNTKLVPSDSAVRDIFKVISIQKEFWPCFKFQVSLPLKKFEPPPCIRSSPRRKDDQSDGEYYTPPTSPPDDKRIPVALREKSPRKTLNEVDEVLVCGLAGISLNSRSCEASVAQDASPSHLEGAVGIDSASCLTIAQLLQEDNELHAVVPLTWCPHLEEVEPVPPTGIDVIGSRCEDCLDVNENWQCLVCYKVLCGRYIKKHMVEHGLKEDHNIVLSHTDLSVWCYSCESYVSNERLSEAKKVAYSNKFGEDLQLVI